MNGPCAFPSAVQTIVHLHSLETTRKQHSTSMRILYLNKLSAVCVVWTMFDILVSETLIKCIIYPGCFQFYALLFQRFPAGLQRLRESIYSLEKDGGLESTHKHRRYASKCVPAACTLPSNILKCSVWRGLCLRSTEGRFQA